MKPRSTGPFQTKFIYLALSVLLSFSTSLNAKTFFMQEEKPADSYYSNDDIRSEEINGKGQKYSKQYSDKHRLVTDYLNSANDPVAADAKWNNETILQVGVIRRSQADLDYAGHLCRLVVAAKFKPQDITVRIIYLPSLVAFDRLELLLEYKCA